MNLQRFLTKALCGAAVVVSSSAFALPSASVNLNSFIQQGTLTNDIGSGANLVGFTYSLGTPGDGIATWDSNGGSLVGGAGATLSNFLSDPNFFQTVSWAPNLAPGASFNFGSLDIDLILTLTPLNTTGGTLDNTGSSLVNAFVSFVWDNNTTATCSLNQTAWATDQNLSCRAGGTQVSEPASLALLGLGIAGLGLLRRRKVSA